jgi:hypothetical protein
MSITLSALQKQRRDTAANWTAANPTLLAGEIGIESDTSKIKIGTGSTAWTSLAYTPWSQLSAYPIVNVDVASNAEIAVSKLADGTARQLLQTDAAGTGVEWASNIDVPGTLDVTGAATFDNNVIIQGDLTVNGTETIINTQTLDVEDKNIVIGKVTTPSDVTADGGGITLKGSTDKTISWIDATDAWTFSEHVNIASAKEYRIAGTKVLDATSLGSGVVSSSLTSVGTIGTGVWQGTAIADTYLATISTAAKVSNSATTATSANTNSAIVARDGSGNFSAGTITAALTGAASSNVLKAGDTMTGALVVPLASASAPSLTFTGDTNTGIYSPGADQLAITTGGTGRLFVDASGNIGIATSNPTSILQSSVSSSSSGLAISTPLPTIVLDDSSGTTGASFWGQLDTTTYFYNKANGNLIFGTNNTERMRLDSSGRLGIGTSVPSQLLTLAQTNAGSAIDCLFLNNSSNASGTAVGIAFGPNTTNDTIRSAIIRGINEAGGAGNSTGLGFFTNTNGANPSEKLRITAGGSVGIGTTVPIRTLSVYSTSSIPCDIESSQNDNALRLVTVGGSGQICGIQNSFGNLLFNASINERARIDSSGRLLVGTSNARSNFFGTTLSSVAQMEGTGGASGRGALSVINNDVSNNPPYVLLGRSGAASLGSNAVVVSGSRLGTLTFHGADGTSFIEAATVAGEVDGNPGSNDMPGRLVFSTTADGAASPTERFRIGSAGQLGIGGANYGTSGQVLTSQGSGTAPVWATAGAGFASGTVMLFVQTTAPTGWTKSTTHDNKALRVVSGTAGTGGSTAFTSVFASRTPSGTVGATTLTEAQIPSHTHSTISLSFSRIGSGAGTTLPTNAGSTTTGATGGGTSHDHSFTGTAMDFAVQYVDVIIATKD